MKANNNNNNTDIDNNNTNPTILEQEQQAWEYYPQIPIPQPSQNWNNWTNGQQSTTSSSTSSTSSFSCGSSCFSTNGNYGPCYSFSFCPAPPLPTYFDPRQQYQHHYPSLAHQMPGFIVQPAWMAQQSQWQLQQNDYPGHDMNNYSNNGNGFPAQGIHNGNIGNNGVMMPQQPCPQVNSFIFIKFNFSSFKFCNFSLFMKNNKP
jgi:hypothetical protein